MLRSGHADGSTPTERARIISELQTPGFSAMALVQTVGETNPPKIILINGEIHIVEVCE